MSMGKKVCERYGSYALILVPVEGVWCVAFRKNQHNLGLIGGAHTIGESMLHTLRREALEEEGLNLKMIQYVGNYTDITSTKTYVSSIFATACMEVGFSVLRSPNRWKLYNVNQLCEARVECPDLVPWLYPALDGNPIRDIIDKLRERTGIPDGRFGQWMNCGTHTFVFSKSAAKRCWGFKMNKSGAEILSDNSWEEAKDGILGECDGKWSFCRSLGIIVLTRVERTFQAKTFKDAFALFLSNPRAYSAQPLATVINI
jgi:ADP-ribose pyrophosphatase YjhB (NUDIX family)